MSEKLESVLDLLNVLTKARKLVIRQRDLIGIHADTVQLRARAAICSDGTPYEDDIDKIDPMLVDRIHDVVRNELAKLIPEQLATNALEISETMGSVAKAFAEFARLSGQDAESCDLPWNVLSDLLEDAWRIIANAGEGNWSNESAEWQTAAHTFRKRYHEVMGPAKRQADRPCELPEVSPSVIYVDAGEVVDVEVQ